MAIKAIDEAKDGLFNKIFGLPDRVENPTLRRVARVAMGLGIAILGVGAFLMMNGMNINFQNSMHPITFDIQKLADPGLMSMMSMPMMLGVAGVGLSWALEDAVGKKHHRTASKISAFLLPLLMAAGIGCIMGASFHGGAAISSFNGYFSVGIIAIPMIALAIGYAGTRILNDKDGQFIHRRAFHVENLDKNGLAPLVPGRTHRREIQNDEITDDDL